MNTSYALTDDSFNLSFMTFDNTWIHNKSLDYRTKEEKKMN